ncbi:thymidylate kinase [Kitasatospora sp. NPDC059817]|uniref:thymidylate kinase n=1 Tax=Kitasatospora sp. NPDC059817 TaxID=3346961 RepID=UPI0036566435
MTAWVDLEGINGVGKTRLGRLVAAVLGELCVPMVELPDSPPGGLPRQVIAALHGCGDRFLRTGHPRTETLLLAALQVHRFESLPAAGAGQVVLEDRGPTSVAVYQAAVLAEANGATDAWALEQAQAIAHLIEAWRPPPTTTVLITDEPGRCLARFEERTGQPCTGSERALISRADRVYHLLANDRPDRYVLLDRRTTGEAEAIEFIAEACRTAAASNHTEGTNQ